MGWFSIGNWYILWKGIHWGGGALTYERGLGVLRSWPPGFFQAIRRSLAYQFTVNVPLLCLPFSCFRNFSHFQPCFGQNSISLDPNFSRKIRSLNPTFWNPRGTHPPEKKLSALPGRYRPTKGPFTNTCKGGLMQKIFIAKIVRPPPPFRQKKKKIRAPLFAMKITGQRRRKAYKLNF